MSKVERWLLPMTNSHLFLLAFFCMGMLAAALGFRSQKGGDMLAFPLFAWSPFLLILGLEQLARGFRKTRILGKPRMTLTWSGICSILVAIAIFVFAYHLRSFWPLFLLLVGLQQLVQGIRKIWNTEEKAAASMSDGSWLICIAITIFLFACYLHSTAPVTRL